MNSPRIEVQVRICADRQRIWDVMTRKQSAMFMGAEVDTDWREGSPITFTGTFNGKPYRDHGEIRVVECERHLAFTHVSGSSEQPNSTENANVIDIWIEPEDGAMSLVRLTQSLPEGQTLDEDHIAAFRANWQAMLDALKRAAEQ